MEPVCPEGNKQKQAEGNRLLGRRAGGWRVATISLAEKDADFTLVSMILIPAGQGEERGLVVLRLGEDGI